jgi:hypothetical protein
MATTKTTTISEIGGILIVDFTADASVEAHVTGNASGTLYLVEIDNTANASDTVYLRIKDAQSAGAAGTLVPTWMFKAPPAAKACYSFPEGQPYGTGLTMWCTSSNAEENTSAPSSAVIVKLIAS